MIRVELQNRIERGQNFVRAGIRLTLRRPLVPWAQVHHRFREKHAGVGIIRKLFPHLAHRVGISAIERGAIFRLRIRVTLAKRVDQRTFDRRSILLIFFGKPDLFPGQLGRGWRHERKINVRTAGQRDTPVRHGAFGIELRGLLERADGRAVIESVNESQALIEITLRLRRIGRDLARI